MYEQRQFRSGWSDPIRLNQLIVATGPTSKSDGLDPRDYHLDALTAIRDELRSAKVSERQRSRADLDLIATDARVLAMNYLDAGKVQPGEDQRAMELRRCARCWERVKGLRVLMDVLDSGLASAKRWTAARPQHVWYERGRERLRQYRRIAADGGWPYDRGGTHAEAWRH